MYIKEINLNLNIENPKFSFIILEKISAFESCLGL